jgi:hypothetical protein
MSKEPTRLSQIEMLHPVVQKQAKRLMFEANAMGLNVGVFETRRLEDRQGYLLDKSASRTAMSWHQFDVAVDVWPKRPGGGWPTQKEFEAWPNWEALGRIGEQYGFEWGGHWRRWPDKAHFEATHHLRRAVLAKILTQHGRGAMHDFITTWIENETHYKTFFQGEPDAEA